MIEESDSWSDSRVYHYGHTIDQRGHHNTMNVGHSGDDKSQHTNFDIQAATAELEGLLDYLVRRDVLSETGSVKDILRLEEIVEAERPRLKRLTDAIRLGAGRALAAAVDNVAAGLVIRALHAALD